MKDIKFYEGKADASEYEELFPGGLVEYPSKRDLQMYRLLYSSTKPAVEVRRENISTFLKEYPKTMPSKLNPHATGISHDNETVVICFIEENADYKRLLKTYNEQHGKLRDLFEVELKDEYLSTRLHAAHSRIFQMAYDRGHSAGMGEVASYYSDYAEFAEGIVSDVNKAKDNARIESGTKIDKDNL